MLRLAPAREALAGISAMATSLRTEQPPHRDPRVDDLARTVQILADIVWEITFDIDVPVVEEAE